MSFLLDTNICSEYLRRPEQLFHYVVQHSGRLHISSVSLSELFAWAHKQDDPTRILESIGELREVVQVLPFDAECAEVLGQIRGEQFRTGRLTSPLDLMIGVTALVNDLTMVTHNTTDFECIPNLRLKDWLA